MRLGRFDKCCRLIRLQIDPLECSLTGSESRIGRIKERSQLLDHPCNRIRLLTVRFLRADAVFAEHEVTRALAPAQFPDMMDWRQGVSPFNAGGL
jgi:hypothetical protein